MPLKLRAGAAQARQEDIAKPRFEMRYAVPDDRPLPNHQSKSQAKFWARNEQGEGHGTAFRSNVLEAQTLVRQLLRKYPGVIDGHGELCSSLALNAFETFDKMIAATLPSVSPPGHAANTLQTAWIAMRDVLFELVFSKKMTAIGEELKGGRMSLTRIPWFDALRDLEYEYGTSPSQDAGGLPDPVDKIQPSEDRNVGSFRDNSSHSKGNVSAEDLSRMDRVKNARKEPLRVSSFSSEGRHWQEYDDEAEQHAAANMAVGSSPVAGRQHLPLSDEIIAGREAISAANVAVTNLTLENNYLRCLIHLMQDVHTGTWEQQKSSWKSTPRHVRNRRNHQELVTVKDPSAASQTYTEQAQGLSGSGTANNLSKRADESSSGQQPEEKSDVETAEEEGDVEGLKSILKNNASTFVISNAKPEVQAVACRAEYEEGLILLQELQEAKMRELRCFDDAITKADTPSVGSRSIGLALSQTFASKFRNIAKEEESMVDYLKRMIETYGGQMGVTVIPDEMTLKAAAVMRMKQNLPEGQAPDFEYGALGSKYKATLTRAWRDFRLRDGRDKEVFVYRTEKQTVQLASSCWAEWVDRTGVDSKKNFSEGFYSFVGKTFADPTAARQTAFSFLVGLETHQKNSWTVRYIAELMNKPESISSFLQAAYVMQIFTVFNGLEACTEKSARSDAYALLTRWIINFLYDGMPESESSRVIDQYYQSVAQLPFESRTEGYRVASFVVNMLQQNLEPRIRDGRTALRALFKRRDFMENLASARATFPMESTPPVTADSKNRAKSPQHPNTTDNMDAEQDIPISTQGVVDLTTNQQNMTVKELSHWICLTTVPTVLRKLVNTLCPRMSVDRIVIHCKKVLENISTVISSDAKLDDVLGPTALKTLRPDLLHKTGSRTWDMALSSLTASKEWNKRQEDTGRATFSQGNDWDRETILYILCIAALHEVHSCVPAPLLE